MCVGGVTEHEAALEWECGDSQVGLWPSSVPVFQCGTAAMECIRQYVSEVLDFMADMHTLTKLKVSRSPPGRPLESQSPEGFLM